MFVLGNLLLALARIFDLVCTIYMYIVIGAVIVSWVNPDPYNQIVRFLRSATEPVFMRVRRIMPGFLKTGRIDWTPTFVLILLILAQMFIGATLADLGYRLRYGSPALLH